MVYAEVMDTFGIEVVGKFAGDHIVPPLHFGKSDGRRQSVAFAPLWSTEILTQTGQIEQLHISGW